MIVVIPRHRSRGWAWYLKGTKNLVGAREAAVTKIAGYLVAFATLIATPVLAADMAAKAPPPAPAPSYNGPVFMSDSMPATHGMAILRSATRRMIVLPTLSRAAEDWAPRAYRPRLSASAAG